MRIKAEELGLTGWVRNRRADRVVEAVIHGETEALDALISWARRGPPASRVTRVDVEEATGDFLSFDIAPTA
jgi:acylphosphatase